MALTSLLLLGWATWHCLHLPYTGATWSWYTGIVDHVDRVDPAPSQLQPGDRILTINGESLLKARQSHLLQAGERLELVVERAGTSRSVTVNVTESPPQIVLREMLPVIIALVFWVLSVAVLIFAPTRTQTWLAFLFSQAMSAVLAAGAMSWLGPLWSVRLFGVLVWWIGPLAILFHLHFPVRRLSTAVHRATLGLFGIAALGSFPELVTNPLELRSQFPMLATLRLLWLATCLFGVVLILGWTYRSMRAPEIQQRIRFVVLGGGLAFLPLLTLSLLPDIVVGRSLLHYEISFLFLLLLPLSYGYAVVRYGLLPINRYISRGTATLLLIVLLSSIYLMLYASLSWLLPATTWEQPLVIYAAALLLGAAAVPLYRWLEATITRFLYGGWHDYQSAVQHVSQTLGQSGAAVDIAQTLCQRLQAAMQLQGACLFLAGETGRLHMASVVGDPDCKHDLTQLQLARDSAIVAYFREHSQMVDEATLRVHLVHNQATFSGMVTCASRSPP